MEHDIVYYHRQLQSYIHKVEQDETDKEALQAVKDTFLIVFDMIKLIMISKQERYYGLFLMNFELRVDFSAYHDAGVSIDSFPFRMTVNPLLIGLKTLPEMIYIFCHEIEHIVLNHPVDGIKYNPKKDPEIGFRLNVAMDVSINDRLTEDNKRNGFDVIAEPEDAFTSAALRDIFKIHVKELQAFDYYFDRIPEAGNDNGNGGYGNDDGIVGSGNGDDGKVSGGSGKGPIKIILASESNQKEIITEPKRKGMVCIPCWTESNDPDEVASIIRRFVEDVCEGMSEAMRSTLPDHQKEQLEKLLAPPAVSWEQLLKRFVGTIPYGHRKTRTRLSRRQPERYDISGSINDRIVKIVVAIDTSGSMSNEDLERIMVEIFDIIGSRKCEVTIIECDAEIQRVYKACSVKDVSFDIQGRGGTSFVPVIEYVNANRYFRDAILIYFTDGMGDRSIPQPLTLRTMWVLQDDQCELSVGTPYGEILVMD
jgi:predicted metal-dependent peptidase